MNHIFLLDVCDNSLPFFISFNADEIQFFFFRTYYVLFSPCSAICLQMALHLYKFELQNMINRPRCRDWTPLATQQLRLRNLIQITGHNIVADVNTSIYFTLHLTLMSAPFFTSELAESFRNAIWSEINCQSIHKSASQAVVVRVWQTKRRRATTSNVIDTANVQQSRGNSQTTAIDLSATQVSSEQSQQQQQSLSNGADDKDKVLFVWAVYFSGLVPITKRTDVKLIKNALVFYIHGGFFTSANYLRGECIPKQYNHFFQPLLQSSPVRATSIASTNFNRNCDKSNSIKTSYRSCYAANDRTSDPFVLSPKWTKPGYDASSIHSGDFLISSTSEAAEVDSQTSADGCDCNDDEQNVLKVRYLDKEFFKWEIRRSYNVAKLLSLQEKQRSYRRETLNANELMEKICMKSASCLNLQLIANKGMLYRPRANPSLGRTLNRLLQTQAEQLKPEDLLRAQELRRKIETAKFRCRLLTMERDRYKVIVRKLNDKCAKLSDDNIEQESYMMNDVRELSRSRDMAIEQKGMYANKQQIFERVHRTLVERQYQLVGELKNVYCIEMIDANGLYEINGHCLPNTDLLCLYYGAMSSNTTQAAASLSIAMGCVAHLVLLCSSILNIPLRLVHFVRR